jgi:hypothetical protein
MGIQNSSQGGGGIFVHGWAHNLQIANDRINNNAGTLSGGINVGQGEFPPGAINGSATNAAPYDVAAPFCLKTSVPTNAQWPYCFNANVNVHNNYITSNSSTGDELFSATPAGAGAVSFCTGADYYLFQYNWVCGNLSSGDGGGLGHLGFSFNGDIEHNSILFNQSTNPTIPANGGGIIVMGAPDADIICNGLNNPLAIDQDCVPAGAPGGNPNNTALSGVGPSDGTGPNLVIDANLIMGNSAEAGSGGGIAFQAVNGGDVIAFPRTPAQWNSVLFQNNIVTNNVAGWDGAGISLLDSLNVNIINNTIASNDTTASSGTLFNTLGAPLASTPPPGPGQPGAPCTANCGTTTHPQPAGLVAIQNSAILKANMGLATTGSITCPTGHPNCRSVSTPLLANDVFWDNRSFFIGVGTLGAGTLNQQNVVVLNNAVSGTRVASEPTADATTGNGAGVIITGGTGACVAGTTYWDLGVRGDTAPTNHSSGVTLAPTYSVISTFANGYNGAALHNTSGNPTFVSQYCNGSRTPPEFLSLGYQVPPGISDATVPNPIFNLTPAATVDEGNNWVNISWGPLSLINATTSSATANTVLGNYAPASSASSVVNYIPLATAAANYNEAPGTDFFGNNRKNGFVDAGAVEFTAGGGGGGTASATLTPASWTLAQNRNCPGTGILGILACTLDPIQVFTLTNTGTVNLTGVGTGVLGGTAANDANYLVAGLLSTCGNATHTTLAPGATCVVTVQFKPLTSQVTGLKPATISVTDSAGTQTSTLNGTAN